MGTILSAKCKCGYTENSLKFGSGMLDVSTSCRIPAIDPRTMNVISYDIKSNADHSPAILYTDPTLHDVNCDCGSYQHFDHHIRAKHNYCPKCHQFSLDFTMEMIYD